VTIAAAAAARVRARPLAREHTLPVKSGMDSSSHTGVADMLVASDDMTLQWRTMALDGKGGG
jgi:hypothetical protein